MVLAAIILGAFVVAFLLVGTIAASKSPSSPQQKWAFGSSMAALLTAGAVLGCVSVAQLKPHVLAHPEQHFVLYHFSRRHTAAFIRAFFATEGVPNVTPVVSE